jgi:magnesium-transporting ATPase (P-type)
VFLLTFTFIKDVVNEYRRYKGDRLLNTASTKIWDGDRGVEEVEWSDVQVGNIVYLTHDEVAPADLLIIATG